MPPRLPAVGPVRPVIGRRQVLASGAALAILVITGSACSSEPPAPAVDELEGQLDLARRDTDLATAAATAAAQPVSAALTQVAAERGQHARALATEIARVAVTPTPTSSQPTSPAPTAAAAPPPSLADVINSLRASATSAGQLATTTSGYRAGLLGSIAAACTAAHSVALVFGGPAS